MIRGILIVIVVAVAAVLVAAAMQPDTYRVVRSTTIQAPPERLYAQVAELRAWGPWSPWEKRDPAMKRTFGGPASGKGATYGWEGNKDVGSGRMEILEAEAPSRILIQLHFLQPFESKAKAEFTFKAGGDATTVTWAMFGDAAFMTKLIGLFMSMDRMVGPDFESGLAGLKAVAEKPAP